VKYDYEKAEKVSENSENITSGAINAFETRKGICFDYSSLFVAMCRSVGLKVRLVTGLAYSGVSWGDHAWNQVYSEEKNRWINVDTTFGSIDNYYDRADFNMDHKNADIQKQWQ
jgi:transglutaminase-like putative cysteine protease